MPSGFSRNTPMRSELKSTLPVVREVAAVLVEDVADARNGARRVVRRGFDQHRDAVRRVALVDDLFEVCGIAPDARLIADSTLSFGMFTAREFWIARRSAGFAFGSEPPFFTAMVMSLPMRELLRHAVPARKHRVLSDFENASHDCSVNSGRAAGREGRAIYPSGESLARWNRARHESLIIKNY